MVTDPRKPVLLAKTDANRSGEGPGPENDPLSPGDKMGAASIQWHAGLGKYVMLRSFEVDRIGLMDDKLNQPDNFRLARHLSVHKESFGLTDYPDYLYSRGYRTWDMSNPAYPKFVAQFAALGQIVGDPAHIRDIGSVNTAPRFGVTDFCQRKGSFGPKRPGDHVTQPGRWKQGVLAYAFCNAGVQVSEVQDPLHARIVACYVPCFPTEAEAPSYVTGNLGYGIYVEYDRNIVWLFTNHAIHALSTPAIGEPLFGQPKTPWPPRG
jgi:hypothetical protein